MFESSLSQVIFYILAVAAVVCAAGVVFFRNPVSSALSMAMSFAFTAAILFGLSATFLGIVQIIVYVGAILVLFLFVVMMMDVKAESNGPRNVWAYMLGAVLVGILSAAVFKTSMALPGASEGACPAKVLCDNATALTTGEQAQPKTGNYGGALPQINTPRANRLANPTMTQEEAARASYSDAKLLGIVLFGNYSIQFVILSFALLVGAVGAVALARKLKQD
ncbi:MAG: NADH-quinone oxidoreductase subunit J [Akkermansia sp.]